MNEAELNDVVDGRLADAFNELGELVTKWVAVAEVIDSEGRRWLRTLYPDGTGTWDRLGMLTYALAEEQAIVGSEA